MTLEMQSRGGRAGAAEAVRNGYWKGRVLHEAVAIERTISDSVAVIYERNKFVYGGSPSVRVEAEP